MTVYRRRLTSSFYAIQQSLQRRLDYLKGAAKGLAHRRRPGPGRPGDRRDGDPALRRATRSRPTEEVPSLFLGEVEYVEDFLADLRALGTDSKFEQLASDLAEVLMRRDSVIIFTQYTDTMDYLRDKLRHVYGAQVACYSGRGGERWDGKAWVGTSKENIKTAFRERQDIKILLCTESASEGLNLQTCGVLINFDLPWNPMRVEQRIGRIDRIGQVYPDVWIRNYFYEDTVEADRLPAAGRPHRVVRERRGRVAADPEPGRPGDRGGGDGQRQAPRGVDRQGGRGDQSPGPGRRRSPP